MSENKDVQPAYPELLGCKASGENCSWTGCFFENIENDIDSTIMGTEGAQEALRGLHDLTKNSGCLKY